MPDQRLMLRGGFVGRGRRTSTGDAPPGEATAEVWRILTGDEPPANGTALAVNMLVAKGNDPAVLIAVARLCFDQLLTANPPTHVEQAGPLGAAVDAGPSALYLMDCWYIASDGPTHDNYVALRKLVATKGEPLVVVFMPVRPLTRLILPT